MNYPGEKMMPYTVSKTCVVEMTRSLATADDNILNITLCPVFAVAFLAI